MRDSTVKHTQQNLKKSCEYLAYEHFNSDLIIQLSLVGGFKPL